MRDLVTGGAGYIGSNLVDALLALGHQVTVVDDLSTGSLANIRHLQDHHRFHFVEGSILDAPLIEGLVAGADCIYHLAALVGVKYVVDDPLRGIQTNVHGTEVVLESARNHGVRTVVASSSEVYGKNPAVPWDEGADLQVGATTVARWSYALSKALDEHLALGYAARGLPVSIVRYFNSYGPRLDPRGYGSVIARFITQARLGRPLTVFGDGTQSRCFTYVADTVQGTILAGTVPEALGPDPVFNIGSDRETRVVDLAALIRDLLGSSSEIVQVPYRTAFGPGFEETRRRVPDVRRAEQILGFRAVMPLEQGLENTITWFQQAWPDGRVPAEWAQVTA